jgi:hypothetical protein
MRTELLAMLGRADESKLKPMVLDAVIALRQSDTA